MWGRLLPPSRESCKRKESKSLQTLALGLLLNKGSLYQREDAKCSQARGSGGGQSRFLCLVHSVERAADEVLGKALTCFLHPAPCLLESLCNTAGDSKSECIRQPQRRGGMSPPNEHHLSQNRSLTKYHQQSTRILLLSWLPALCIRESETEPVHHSHKLCFVPGMTRQPSLGFAVMEWLSLLPAEGWCLLKFPAISGQNI